MRPYETLVVLSNELGGEREAFVQRLQSVISDNGGKLDACHDWGNRKLAYMIKKTDDGHYYLFEYNAEPGCVSELERTLRIADGVLRYMSVQQEHTGLPQARPTEAPARRDVPMHELRSGDAARTQKDAAPRPPVRDAGDAVAQTGDAAQQEAAKSDE